MYTEERGEARLGMQREFTVWGCGGQDPMEPGMYGHTLMTVGGL